MTLSERLGEVVRGMPDGGSVTLPVSWLRELLEHDDDDDDPLADLTVEEVGELLGRAPSTVRGWLISGVLRGYKLRGREWRVPRTAVAEFIAGERDRADVGTPDASSPVDLGAWRREYAGSGAP